MFQSDEDFGPQDEYWVDCPKCHQAYYVKRDMADNDATLNALKKIVEHVSQGKSVLHEARKVMKMTVEPKGPPKPSN